MIISYFTKLFAYLLHRIKLQLLCLHVSITDMIPYILPPASYLGGNPPLPLSLPILHTHTHNINTHTWDETKLAQQGINGGNRNSSSSRRIFPPISRVINAFFADFFRNFLFDVFILLAEFCTRENLTKHILS